MKHTDNKLKLYFNIFDFNVFDFNGINSIATTSVDPTDLSEITKPMP